MFRMLVVAFSLFTMLFLPTGESQAFFGHRGNVVVNAGGGGGVAVSVNGNRRNNVLVANGNVVVSNRGVFGRNRSTVVVNNGFGNNAVLVNGGRLNSFNSVRVNTFGTQTFVDGGGNVFEVDAFGNSAFRGNSFRGFGVGGFSAVNRSFFVAPSSTTILSARPFCP